MQRNRTARAATGRAVIIAAVLGLVSPDGANAAFTITAYEEDGYVSFYGGGSLDLSALSGPLAVQGISGFLDPAAGTFLFGTDASQPVNVHGYAGSISGPTAFGPGTFTGADEGSWDVVGVVEDSFLGTIILVPEGYVSNASFISDATFYDATFADLGLTPGLTHVWSWGDPPETLTLEVDCVVDGLVAHWAFDGNADDATPCQLDGVVSGAALATGYDGTPGGAFSFTDPGDAIDFGPYLTLTYSFPVTLSVWVRHSCPPTDFCPIFDNEILPGTYSGISLQLVPNGYVEATYGDGGPPSSTSRRSAMSTSSVPSGAWHHVAVVMHDGANFDIYIDGIQDSLTWSGTGGSLYYHPLRSYPARVGNNVDGTAPFNGEIDELMLFRRALTSQEVIELPEPGLVPGLGAGSLFLIALARRRRSKYHCRQRHRGGVSQPRA